MQSRYAESLAGERDSQIFLKRKRYTTPKRSGVFNALAEKPTNANAIGEGWPNDDGKWLPLHILWS